MRENIERGLGLHASSRVLSALVERAGLSREQAYEIVQRAALAAADARRPLRELLAVEPVVARSLSLADLDACFDDARHLTHVPEVIARLDTLVPREAAGRAPRGHPEGRRPMLAAEPFVRSGKVRDLYAVDADRLLLVASDRISAFDVVLPTPIPDKGRVLTGLSRFWFDETALDRPEPPASATSLDDVPDGRSRRARARSCAAGSMVCRRASVLPVEIVVRGYLVGLGLEGVPAHGSRVRRAAARRASRERPAARADLHARRRRPSSASTTMNIDFDVDGPAPRGLGARDGDDWLGRGRGARRSPSGSRDVALRLYELGAARCAAAGIILADTKFEMGLVDGELILVDEVLTPDSSRFWDAATYEPGGPRRASTSSSCATGSRRSRGTRRRPGRSCPTTSSPGRAHATSRRSSGSPGASFERYLRRGRDRPEGR